MMLPEQLKPYFPSYDFAALDSKENKKLIITILLNFGDKEAINWLFGTYETPEIVEAIQNPSRGSWTKKSLNYWRIVFDVDVDESMADRALWNLDPRPDTYEPIFA